MKRLTLIVSLIAIIAFCTALYFLFAHFSPPTTVVVEQVPTTFLSPTQIPSATCHKDQISATVSAQGAAGSTYANLELVNTGKTSCEMELGNTIIATVDNSYIVPKNIIIHFVQNIQANSYVLAPGAKLYSQVHYPNGPQCQSGVEPKQISFLLDQTGIMFQPIAHSGKLMLQACSSPSEKTTIDIWPLSKTPITQ